MATVRNNAIFFTVAALLIVAAIIGFSAKVGAQPSSITIEASATATSTVAYLVPGVATSTYQFDNPAFSSGKPASVAQIDSAYVYLQAAASSTATVFSVTPQFSNNNIDWYNYGTATTTVSATGNSTVTGPTNYQWTPGTTATSSEVIRLPDVAAQHERIVVSSASANGAVYYEVVLKKNPSTP